MNMTKLYHCTDFESLLKILKSQAFHPSYCYERAEYIENPEDFAFAMVCFADLLDGEVKHHLKKFNKDCYLQMNKEWAKKNGLSNVIYYNKASVVATLLKNRINDIIKRAAKKAEELSNEIISTSLLMAYFKQYEGNYWNDKESKWSEHKSLFYTEREWRYIPIVQNSEAFYLSPEEFLNRDLRQLKRKELIDNGYTLKFDWNDIEHIGVHSFKQWYKICKYLTTELNYNTIEVIKKVKIKRPRCI